MALVQTNGRDTSTGIGCYLYFYGDGVSLTVTADFGRTLVADTMAPLNAKPTSVVSAKDIGSMQTLTATLLEGSFVSLAWPVGHAPTGQAEVQLILGY